MKLAGVNSMTVGVFSWVSLEPEEGKFTFGWLDDIMDRLAKAGMFAVLATPSGARPAWMSQKYPEVLRVRSDRQRNLHGLRHNHCFTSPVYREKCRLINTKLAERYKDHPALLVWHVSNEYRRRVPLRPLPAGLPRVAATAIRRQPGRAQQGLVDGVLEPDVHRLGADRVALQPRRERAAGAEPGLAAVRRRTRRWTS